MDALYLGILDMLNGFVPHLGTAPTNGGYAVNELLASFLTYALVWLVIGRPLVKLLSKFGGK